MAFEPLSPVRAPKSNRKPVAVALQRRGSASARPSTMIFIDPAFAKALEFANCTRLSCEVGTGVHAGLLRLRRADDGAFEARMRKAGVVIDLGYVDRFGHRSQAKEYVEAGIAGAEDGLLIQLPSWSGRPAKSGIPQEASGTAREAPSTGSGTAAAKPRVGTKSAPPTPLPKNPVSPDPAPAQPSIAGDLVTIASVTIEKTLGSETISTGLGHIETSRRGAQLVEALLRANFLPIDVSRCIRILWPEKQPHGVETLLDMVISDLKSLQKIGLKVEKLKGIGVKLTLMP